jgi:hypothetical protein
MCSQERNSDPLERAGLAKGLTGAVRMAFLLFSLVIFLGVAWAQFHELGSQELSSQLELTTRPNMPIRVYLFKIRTGKHDMSATWIPFRLSPVDALLPLKPDNFYRERFWYMCRVPDVLEVLCEDQSHFFLLRGKANFELPPGKYRVEAHRGFFYIPASQEFELKPGESLTVPLQLANWAGDEREEWISCDPHVHIMRPGEDEGVLLDWLEAEDLNVICDLQIQRQSEASVQYGFGPEAEARRGRYSVRSGEESRSEVYGHIGFLGLRELLRPISVGLMYSNTPLTYPYPALSFPQARSLGGTVGYVHFNGSMRHSTLLMCLALGKIDFAEVLAFGYLNTEGWYELLNAGLRFTGTSGSDFPVLPGRTESWPSYLPLLGAERTLVRTRAEGSPYEAWAAGVRAGGSDVIVTNGPLVDIKVDEKTHTALASGRFFRPLELLEIVLNGKVISSVSGDGQRTSLSLSARLPENESFWVAARVRAERNKNTESDADLQVREEAARKIAYQLPALAFKGEPVILAHTNPVYVLHEGRPAYLPEARQIVAERWEKELEYYRTAPLVFSNDAQKREFFDLAEKALSILRNPPSRSSRDSP